MYPLKNKIKPLWLSLILILFLIPSSCQEEKKVTVYRDNWGIPHIYANSESALFFAYGYAQSEDRLEQILRNYRYAEGTLAEAFGADQIESDLTQRIWQHAKISQERFNELSESVKTSARFFIAGVRQYMSDHPDQVPGWAPDIQPWHVVALGRAFIWDWPLGQARSDLRRGKTELEKPHHSNQWVVSRQRTADRVPIALIDPHLNFFSSGHWYEARLHAGDLQVAGMGIAGTPFIGLGHNEYISWSATTGGPDCADVYELEISPENPLQYKYDDTWRDIQVEIARIRVKDGNDIKTIEKTIERSHYGPIYGRNGFKAYAFRLAYAEEVLLPEQMLKINKARNLTEFIAALSMCQMMPQNMMCATTDGNIYYARTGRVPIRPAGFDWDYPVPGNTSKSEWLGIHTHDDLIQIINPGPGFMQNCNISPGTMMPNSPFTRNRYHSYIYNDEEDRSNPRGRTALKLLGAENKLTLERAKEIALDTRADRFEIWQTALRIAFNHQRQTFKDLEEAVKMISDWNGHLDADNTSAALYRFWRRACNEAKVDIPWTGEGAIKPFSENQEKLMLRAVQQACRFLTEKFGTYRIAWGEAVRLRRGDNSWPVSGGSFENGVNVLRAAGGKFSEDTGITTIDGGQSCCMVVILSDPIQSFSILPWGESDHPDSPHYSDQAEALFSKSQFKSTYFNKDELLNNLESTTEMTVPAIVNP
jgi:penicillin amidase